MSMDLPSPLPVTQSGNLRKLAINGTPLTSSGFTSTAATAFTVSWPASNGQGSVQIDFQNNTAYPVTRDYEFAAGAGSLQVVSGGERLDALNTTSVSVYCAQSITVNSSTVAGLRIEVS